MLGIFLAVLPSAIGIGIPFLVLFLVVEFLPTLKGYSSDEDRVEKDMHQTLKFLPVGGLGLFLVTVFLPFISASIRVGIGFFAATSVAVLLVSVYVRYLNKAEEQTRLLLEKAEAEALQAEREAIAEEAADEFIEEQIQVELRALGLELLEAKWSEQAGNLSQEERALMSDGEIKARMRFHEGVVSEIEERFERGIEESENVTRLPTKDD